MSVWQPLGPEKIIICAASVSSTMSQTLGCCQCSFKMQCFCKFIDFRAPKLYWPSATFTQLVLPFLSDFNRSSLQSSLLVMSLIFQSTNPQMLTDIPSVPDVLLDTCREHAKKKKKKNPWCLLSRLGCSCTIFFLLFAVAFLLPSTWLVHLDLLVSTFGGVVFKELWDNKDKSFNNLERKLNWYGKSELINGTALLFLMLPTMEWLLLLRNVFSIFWVACLLCKWIIYVFVVCWAHSICSSCCVFFVRKKLYWDTVT